MDWEAFWAVGAVTLVLGVVLLVPGLMLGRKLSKTSSNEFVTSVITKHGLFFGVVFVVSLLLASAARYFAPNSFIGHWTATDAGLYSFIAVLSVLAMVIEKILLSLGINLVSNKC
ncbi:hypothetical protein J3L11_08705 [Shewanella sp. 4t3-1-2LB]|uniref:hypothetical protein n=1 Tax=Shewanella sp. 4t3-1-2LB TaxID=2817682 RepID=UPI001A99D085|nr:hypothetical protein [Shewanella sp. 4t3-1-2LB]MBO1271719.1 hypothetical protein [Shewanella sp. 4t3-1-2LB]